MVPQARCPSGKIRYMTKHAATVALNDLVAQALEHPARLAKLGIYLGGRCCGGWHVGHNFKPASQRTARRGKHKRLTPIASA